MLAPGPSLAVVRLVTCFAIGTLVACGGTGSEEECAFPLAGGCLDGIDPGDGVPVRPLRVENQSAFTFIRWEDVYGTNEMVEAIVSVFDPPVSPGTSAATFISDLPGRRFRVVCTRPDGLASRSRTLDLDSQPASDVVVVRDEDLGGIFAACSITGLDLSAPTPSDGIRIRASITYDLGPAAVDFGGAWGAAALEFEFSNLPTSFGARFDGAWQGELATDDWSSPLSDRAGTIEVELDEFTWSDRALHVRVRCLLHRHEAGQGDTQLWPLWIRSNELPLTH